METSPSLSLSRGVKEAALDWGADLVGICAAEALAPHDRHLRRIMPTAISVVVVAVRHSTGALDSEDLREGGIDRRKCGDAIFAYGLRAWGRLWREILGAQDEALRRDLFYGFSMREIWQTFMTGNYYYCFECQSACPVFSPGGTAAKGAGGCQPSTRGPCLPGAASVRCGASGLLTLSSGSEQDPASVLLGKPSLCISPNPRHKHGFADVTNLSHFLCKINVGLSFP